MKMWPRSIVVAGGLVVTLGVGLAHTPSAAQDAGGARPGADSLEAINADYLRELTALERKRMQRLEKLAATAKGEEATLATVSFFQAALTSGHYRDAEALAEKVLTSGHPEVAVHYLAEVTNILSEIDRGAYEESLASLGRLLDEGRKAGVGAVQANMILPADTRLSLMETFYQKLVQADQFDIARKGFELIAEKSQDQAIREYAANRVARLERIGKPAPAISGPDVDGKTVSLADLKGNVVLVVFWATWCLPCAQEADMLEQVAAAYKDQGFRVLAINVDTMQESAPSRDEVLSDVRRFLVEHNVRFPSLVNGSNEVDYAKLFGVREIPANFLIDRDGTVGHVDLTAANIDKLVKAALAK
jgi:peroxiredoxin